MIAAGASAKNVGFLAWATRRKPCAAASLSMEISQAPKVPGWTAAICGAAAAGGGDGAAEADADGGTICAGTGGDGGAEVAAAGGDGNGAGTVAAGAAG